MKKWFFLGAGYVGFQFIPISGRGQTASLYYLGFEEWFRAQRRFQDAQPRVCKSQGCQQISRLCGV